MAILKGGGLNEGSLLRRTLLHIGTFAIGSLAFVAVLSFTLVTVAKSLLPSPPEAKGKEPAAAAAEEGEGASTKSSSSKSPKAKRPAGSIVQTETPDSEK
ncbi:MAG TPA: hypothetical protein VE093_03370 [Polyangiaceae bacterium]|jgi:hypothetical protein|nr:hypothetical protein [Polyangiaceae bacterium]